VLIRILAFHIPIVAMDMVLAAGLQAKDRQKAWLIVGGIAAVFNPLVNLVAIPLTSHRFGDGAIGAAIVTVGTELVMMIGAIYLRPAGVLDRGNRAFILRCMAASVAMIPPILLASQSPFGVKVIIGVATFTVASVILRLVSVRAVRDSALHGLRSFRQRGRLSPVPTGVE
jgi:O-antigen/teichoic acid export membrane protein